MIGVIAFLSAAMMAPPEQSQSRAALTACLKSHLTKADGDILVRWIFVGMARGAQVRDLAPITEARRISVMQDAGKVVGRLMTVDCRSDMVAALKSGSKDATKEAFSELGETAVAALIADEEVTATFTGVIQYVDLAALLKVLIDGRAIDPKN